MSEFGEQVVEQNSPDADAALGYEPTTPEQAPEEGHPAEANEAEDWAETGDEVEEQAQETEQQTDAEPEKPEKIFGKYNDMETAARGFQNLNSTLGRQSQELGQLRQQNTMLMQIIQQGGVQQPFYQAPGQTLPPAYGPQRYAPAQQQTPQKRDPQKVWESIAEDPEKAIAELVQPLVEQRLQQQQALLGAAMQQFTAPLQPIAQQWQMQQVQQQLEHSFREQVDHLAIEYPDMPDFIEDMKAQVAQNPQVLAIPGALEKIYKAVRHDRMNNQAQTQRTTATKKAARMPQTTASRIPGNTNDKLVDELLGPSSEGGEWG